LFLAEKIVTLFTSYNESCGVAVYVANPLSVALELSKDKDSTQAQLIWNSMICKKKKTKEKKNSKFCFSIFFSIFFFL